MFSFLRNIGAPELIIIAVVVFFFFGGSKLGEFARGLKESKKELGKIKEDLQNPDSKKDETS
jgi:Sec-independent protein translocase protein TatA